MSNLSENRIDTVLTAAAVKEIKIAVETIDKALPMVSLTDKQRSDMMAIDVDNKVFADDALAELKRKGEGVIPSFVKAETMENDGLLFNQIDDLRSDLLTLIRKVSDIHRIVGHEYYGTGLMIYRIFEAASKAGIPDTKESAEKLGKRFAAQQKGAPEQTGL